MNEIQNSLQSYAQKYMYTIVYTSCIETGRKYYMRGPVIENQRRTYVIGMVVLYGRQGRAGEECRLEGANGSPLAMEGRHSS